MLLDEYTFQIVFNGATTVVEPVNDDFIINWEEEDGEIFLRQTLSTEFVFCESDYKILEEIENSCNRCLKVLFRIICKADNELIFDGYLNMNKGKWSPCFCQVSFTPITQDEYSCIYEKCEIEKNILATTPKVTVSQFIGVVECETCTQFIPSIFVGNPLTEGADCSPPLLVSEGWTVTYNSIEQGASQNGISTEITTRYCREFFAGTVQPPGATWVAVAGGFARPVNAVFTNQTTTTIATNVILREYFFTVAGYEFESEDEDGNIIPAFYYEYDNGMKLEDVLNLFLFECGLPIKSNFFGINPDNTAPNNTAYQFAALNYHNIIIYEISDIINADATENATISNRTLKAILNAFKCLEVYWKVIDGKICIEHISYFEEAEGTEDITNDPCIDKLESYTYSDESTPQFEKFKWLFESSEYFAGNDITYTGFCVDFGESEDKDCEAYTDLNHAIANLENNSKGLFFMSTVEFNGQFYVNNSNNSLSFTEIHENLFLWNRCQSEGIINGQPKTFFTFKRIKEQEPLTTDFCCADFKEYDPSKLVKTQLGWGQTKSASFSAKGKCITREFIHNQNC